MPCLIAGDDHARAVGEVADPGVLEAVELVFVAPAHASAEEPPSFVELVGVLFLGRWPEVLAEKIEVAGEGQDPKIEHEPYYRVVEADVAVALVLGIFLAHEYALIFKSDVLYPEIAELGRADEGVVFHEAGQKKISILFPEVSVQLAHHLFCEGLPFLGVFADLGDTFGRIILDVFPFLHPRSESAEPTFVVVPGSGAGVAVEQDVVQEFDAEFSVEFVGVFQWPVTAVVVFPEDLDP